MKSKLFDYDDRDLKSVFYYAKQLENMTFNDVKEIFENNKDKRYINKYEDDIEYVVAEEDFSYGASMNERAKGQLGNFIERFYFGYEPNSNQDADFPKIGLELKITPIDRKKNGSYRAGERLSITNISYNEAVEEDFYKSHLYKKIKTILLIHYLRNKDINRMDYQIKFVNIFSPEVDKNDMKIIIEDYNYIVSKIKAGKAHELSESDTLYLGACTKGTNAARSMQPQFYGGILAKKRNFCFKISYMEYILQTKVLKRKLQYESVIGLLENETFEQHIINKIKPNYGKTDKELCEIFNREYNNNKAQWNDLTFKMLGVTSNNVEEFKKANIVVKTIRVESDNKIKENMSFPPFKFKDLADEEWEESALFNYFYSTKFLFVVFRKNGSQYILETAKMWNMPYVDLNNIVRNEWLKIQSVIKEGVNFTLTKDSSGKIIVKNNIPGISDSEILHVRPHAQKSAYKLANGFMCGNIKRDANELPDGQWMTTQSFWINRFYVLKQIMEK